MSAPSAASDTQLPQDEQVFLDHVGYFTSDLDQAGQTLQHLGFQVSDVNVQASLDETGALVAAGTSNRLVRLRRGFLEVLAATGDTPLAAQLRTALGHHLGLHLIALSHRDIPAQRRRLVAAGWGMQPVVELRRPVTAEHSAAEVAWSVLRPEPGVMPEGRVQFVASHTPELSWPPGTMRHDNAADAIGDVWVCVKDLDEAAARYARYTNRPLARRGQTRVLALDRAALIFTPAETAHQTMPSSRWPAPPFIAGIALTSTDLAATDRALAEADTTPILHSLQKICLPPEAALGASLLFHSPATATPWDNVLA